MALGLGVGQWGPLALPLGGTMSHDHVHCETASAEYDGVRALPLPAPRPLEPRMGRARVPA
jgi:hypothetical protein